MSILAAAAPAQAGDGAPPPQPRAFYWVDEMPAARTVAEPAPALPDLAVHWIERLPRYPRYCVEYSLGLPRLCPGTETEPRFPQPGQRVRFVAEIANQGGAASAAGAATWRMGEAVTLQPLPALAAGEAITLTVSAVWPAAPLTVTLTLEAAGALPEITLANNQRQHRTDAIYLEVLVHPLVYAAFERRATLAGSWGFEDWMQAQVAALNDNLAASVYPAAPHGVPDRVRIDRIQVTDDTGGGTVTSDLEFDGRWTFRVDWNDPDTPEDEAALSAENYAAAFAGQIDWGLVHELTHQLGAIDLYQLNVGASYQNQALDLAGRPALIGFEWPRPDLMGGGDRGDYPWFRYSEHTVLGVSTDAGQRRGYYGEYLFDVPGHTSLLILDNRGQPLPGAQVTAYQTRSNVVQAEAVWRIAAGADGRAVLPNRPVSFGGVSTATGHTLGPNPFGDIDVVGANGQLLLQISRSGQEFYTWLPITELNLARWHGQTAYQRTVATSLAPDDAPLAPAALGGWVEGDQVRLSWPASLDPAAVAYRVYRGQEPAYYPFQPITTTTALSYTGDLERTARYAVTTLDAAGRESAFSPLFRAPRLILPVGVVWQPADGATWVLDRHDGSLLWQTAGGEWIGRQGSVHLGLTGSQSLAANAEGQMLAAVTSEDRIKVLSLLQPGSEGIPQLVNWFGRDRFVDGELAAPSGVAQLPGPAFSVAARPQADAGTLGLADFDNTLALSGSAPLLASGVSLAPGYEGGHGVRMHAWDRLEYAAQGRLDPNQGAVSLWVKPEWLWDEDQEHVFLEIGVPGNPANSYRLRLAKASWNGLYAVVSDGVRSVGLFTGIETWQPGQWHHLAVAWQPAPPNSAHRRYTLWVDGALRDSQVSRRALAGARSRLSVGASLEGQEQAGAVLDELHLSAWSRVGNSRQVHLAVSQSAAGRVEIFDWLGIKVASLDGFDTPQAILAAPGKPLVVADGNGGALHVLSFDGYTLRRVARWSAGLSAPYGLAEGGGSLWVSDRSDQQIKELGWDGAVLRTWREPNDGQRGAFDRPGGLAWQADRRALVIADTGNGRVARVMPAGPATRLALPLVEIR